MNQHHVAEMFQRQAKILDPIEAGKVAVTICGCGTVGSNAAVQLAKLGINKFELFDMDTVGLHNIPSQEFTLPDVGESKVDALIKRLRCLIPDIYVSGFGELEGYENFAPGIVLLAVDSMDVRKTIFETSIKGSQSIDFVMDVRMGGPTIEVRSFNPRDNGSVTKYEKTLYSSAESVPLPCGTTTFAPVGALAGAIVAQLVANFIAHRPLPFYCQMNLEAFDIKTSTQRVIEADPVLAWTDLQVEL